MNALFDRHLPAGARCLYRREQVETALDQMALHITRDLAGASPLVIGVMTGALPTLGYLLTRLPFELEVDYVHATRYGGEQSGGELVWQRYPERNLEGRAVLVVDDILDRGLTLAAVVDYCRTQGALSVATAVLAQKRLSEAPALQADYCALELPNEFVFGYGMDLDHRWRNAPGIFSTTPAME